MEKEVLRRLDTFGRVVVPKDMRQRLFIADGDPVTVSFEKNSIVLRPFVPLTEMDHFFSLCIQTAKRSDLSLVITSRTEVLYSFAKDMIKGIPIPGTISALITSRKVHDVHESGIPIVQGSRYRVQAVYPIVSYGELYGAIVPVNDSGAALTEEQHQKLSFLRDLIAEEVNAN